MPYGATAPAPEDSRVRKLYSEELRFRAGVSEASGWSTTPPGLSVEVAIVTQAGRRQIERFGESEGDYGVRMFLVYTDCFLEYANATVLISSQEILVCRRSHTIGRI